jgi:hypothetical protein
MSQPNSHNSNGSSATIQEPGGREIGTGMPAGGDALEQGPELATRARQRARRHIQQNRFVIVGAGAIVVALLIFVATSIPSKRPAPKSKNGATTTTQDVASESSATPGDKSLFPITDSGRPVAKETHDGFLNERDLQRTATGRPTSRPPRGGQGNAAGTLASIPPFGDQQTWQAPPYQPGTSVNNGADLLDPGKAEREAMEKTSLVYVRRISASQGGDSRREEIYSSPGPDIGLGLATGTRLRARLESAASTAVRTPVLAVIEYTYEREGEIVVPAGARVIGHMQDADRSGYVRIEFDSLMMPDGAAMPIQAVATDLEMGPLKGKVEGKNTGKNVLVRSLSGIGQVGATLVGRGNLNQPLSESDLVRERVSNNIGEAGDEQISRMAVTQHIVVTILANTPIYVVLVQTPKSKAAWTQSGVHSTQLTDTPNAEELRQLLQLQRELNQPNTTTR